MTPMADLSGRAAVITGASSGIGRAVALACAKVGIHLCLVGRDTAALETVVADAAPTIARMVCCRADLSSLKGIRNVTECVTTHFGRVDLLVHSAGVIAHGTMADASPEEFDRHFHTNVRGPYFLTQELLPWLKSTRGLIVFVNSSLGVSARGGVGQYAATKHALKALADSLRDEVNGEGVRVLSVFLGRTATPMQAAVHSVERKEYRPERLMQPEDVAETILHSLQLPLTAEITEIHMRPMQRPR